jgi:prepilin-type N-terminal cleavage/methylation domain-containing protein
MIRINQISRRNREAGFTMIELMVALAIFSIFLTIVISSILALTKASTTAQVTAKSSSAELAMFSRLDHQIRYSDSINWPGTGASGDYYIEFRTPADSTTTLTTLCTQWMFNPTAGTISTRSWNDGSAAGSTWTILLTNVKQDTTIPNYPFALIPASAGGSSMQEFKLTVETGNTNVKGATITTTFVARNSGVLTSPSNSDATTPGVSDTPICTGATRP